ncbi:MAG: restriction endonuclease [Chloroflexota bacterium]|nr:restriction endonuclease [Chloroflexota bacterium]
MLQDLTLDTLKQAATLFAKELSESPIPDFYGATDDKAIGAYIEQRFKLYLEELYVFVRGNADSIDLPELEVDFKATSTNQPQSLSPFKNASQKVYGLGYHLLIFVYSKTDEDSTRAANLEIKRTLFIKREYTADWQTTKGIIDILDLEGNVDDLVAFLEERNLPLDEIGRVALANRIIEKRPNLGYLTISNALQWRLQYSRAIQQAGQVVGIENLGD